MPATWCSSTAATGRSCARDRPSGLEVVPLSEALGGRASAASRGTRRRTRGDDRPQYRLRDGRRGGARRAARPGSTSRCSSCSCAPAKTRASSPRATSSSRRRRGRDARRGARDAAGAAPGQANTLSEIVAGRRRHASPRQGDAGRRGRRLPSGHLARDAWAGRSSTALPAHGRRSLVRNAVLRHLRRRGRQARHLRRVPRARRRAHRHHAGRRPRGAPLREPRAVQGRARPTRRTASSRAR